jgi:hypothetical protein
LIWLHILTPLLAIKGKVSKHPPERREKIEQKEVAILAVLGDGMEPIPTAAKKSVVFFTNSHSIVLTLFSHGRNQEQGAPKVCK